MPGGKDSAQIKAWLHETARLLSDMPQAILFNAIDDCVKEPGRRWPPTVGEIRDKAAQPWQRQGREAARLRRLVNLMAEGVEIPAWAQPAWGTSPRQAEPVCTPDEAQAILKEFGLRGDFGDNLAGMLTPEKPMTATDYIAEGRDPPPIKPERRDPWEMMS